MGLRLIGTGFGRTGTDSMREALNLIGFGPCHHMREVMEHPEQKEMWRAVARGASPDWDRLFEGYGSCLDWPSVYFWRDLVAHFPGAKVLLTWRDAESWWESFSKTIAPVILKGNDPDSIGEQMIVGHVFGGRRGDKAAAIASYEANVAAVKAEVPAERLLVFEIGDGWEPLCAHLGVPVPDVPFPHANKAASFKKEFGKDTE